MSGEFKYRQMRKKGVIIHMVCFAVGFNKNKKNNCDIYIVCSFRFTVPEVNRCKNAVRFVLC